MEKIPILVTGSHRSGTTWVGKMLCKSRELSFVWEPFNVGRVGPRWTPKKLPLWFYHIPPENDNNFVEDFQNIIQLRYPIFYNILRIQNLRQCGRMGRDWLLSIHGRISGKRTLIKDPIAIFSAEWLANQFNMKVIVMIRHPLSFASSLKRLDWQFDFSNWLNQDLLMQEYLSPYREQIADFSRNKRNIIDQAILLWNGIYYVVHRYQKDHPEWLFIKQEDLAENPVDGFQSLYKECDLTWNDYVKSIIIKYSNQANIGRVPDGVSHIIRRNSRATITAWKHRLSKEEVDRIYKGTREIAHLFYSE